MLKAIMFRAGVVALGLLIVVMSITRASWDLLAEEGVWEQLKTGNIDFTINFSDGETKPASYRFPDAGMLPNQMFYGMKTIRDYLWLNFSRGTDKIKLSILLADKKAKEFDELLKIDKPDLALESGNQAVDKLQYADKLIKGDTSKHPEIKLLRNQVLTAGYAYKQMFQDQKDMFNFDSAEEYTKLLNRIDEWNKQEEETRFNWDY